MADTKISALPPATGLDGTEPVPIVQSGTTVQTTTQDIADLASGSSPTSLTAPSGGWVQIDTTTGPLVLAKFKDNGGIDLAFAGGSSNWTLNSGGVEQTGIHWATPGVTWNVASTIWAFGTTGGGQMTIDGAFNALLVSGFTTVTIQVTGLNPAFWGGPGVPADVGTAIDRIANVVSGGGVTPIP